jgi:hypothetical protein
MLIQKIKEVSEIYKKIDFAFSYSKNVWEIKINSINEELDDITEDEDSLYDILKCLMPDEYIVDFDGEILGRDNLEYHSYMISNNKEITFFDGEVLANGLFIKETTFDSAIDFYIHLFSSFENVEISTKEILFNKIDTPLQIFINHIATKGIKLDGFKRGIDEFDGYTNIAFDLQLTDGNNILVEFPKKDALSFNEYLKFSNFEMTDIFSYNSEFLELLEAIDADDLESYISSYIWE